MNQKATSMPTLLVPNQVDQAAAAILERRIAQLLRLGAGGQTNQEQ